MKELTYYDRVLKRFEAISKVGNELQNRMKYCIENAEQYENTAKERDAAGECSDYYLEWAENERTEAKIWEQIEEMFRETFIN